jgi:hypothetical protein
VQPPVGPASPPTAVYLRFDDHVDLLAQAVDVAIEAHTWIHGIVDLVGGNPAVAWHGPAWPGTNTMLDGLSKSLRLIPADNTLPHFDVTAGVAIR